MKLLALGDVVGEEAIKYLALTLPEKRREYGADLVIANGENAANIHGLSPAMAETLLSSGVDLITSGNHIFDRRDIYPFLDTSPAILRPANYPAECPGVGARVVTSADGWQVLVVNVSGVAFMEPLSSPFSAAEYALTSFRGRYDLAVMDVHAEATSEKLAIAHCFGGKFAAIFGTHTHIPTADARVFESGTAYITDLGMTGPVDGILGVEKDAVIGKMRTHMPHRFFVASGEIRAQGALFDLDGATGKARSVRRIEF